MAFTGLLFPLYEPHRVTADLPLFHDLHLSVIIAEALRGREEYRLEEYFYSPVLHKEEVIYRQEVMQDISRPDVCSCIESFASHMKESRRWEQQAAACYDIYEKASLQLRAICAYVEGTDTLYAGLRAAGVLSEGMQSFLAYMESYYTSPAFQRLWNTSAETALSLEGVVYALYLQDAAIEVRPYEGEADVSHRMQTFFARFFTEETPRFSGDTIHKDGLNHIEARIVQKLAAIYPHVFEGLLSFCGQAKQFREDTLLQFERESQFFLAYLTCIRSGKERGLLFCYPEAASEKSEIYCEQAYDLALAIQSGKDTRLVPNSFSLRGTERNMVVTGPNQGGKTTFARMIGQLVYLASLGLPIPAKTGRIFLPDAIYTHFERQEREVTANGKLQDDVERIYDILQQATTNSLIIINEMFASAVLKDSLCLGRKVMHIISRKDLYCVYVTFLEDLASFDEKTVSMVCTIAPDLKMRTYQIVRQPADGKAYAYALAARYNLGREDIIRRVLHESMSTGENG
ncbi:MutS-related protein [Megasphaera sueciensis]|jgi:hypothetical protein|uniref:MutS-related protein n=1 Tax=Megasphaera sueciensis TaxID=349094 RepID=UPI003D03113C